MLLQRALELGRSTRKLAAEERVTAAYAKEDFQKAEFERIRIAVKRQQRLDYMDKIGAF